MDFDETESDPILLLGNKPINIEIENYEILFTTQK